MKMIERVARAMVAEDSGPEGSMLFDLHWKEFGEGYTCSARAAIEAMLNPTDAMIEAGVNAEYGGTLGSRAANCFNAMIDAALE